MINDCKAMQRYQAQIESWMAMPLYKDTGTPKASGQIVPGLSFRTRFDTKTLPLKAARKNTRIQGKNELDRSPPNALNKLIGTDFFRSYLSCLYVSKHLERCRTSVAVSEHILRAGISCEAIEHSRFPYFSAEGKVEQITIARAMCLEMPLLRLL